MYSIFGELFPCRCCKKCMQQKCLNFPKKSDSASKMLLLVAQWMIFFLMKGILFQCDCRYICLPCVRTNHPIDASLHMSVRSLHPPFLKIRDFSQMSVLPPRWWPTRLAGVRTSTLSEHRENPWVRASQILKKTIFNEHFVIILVDNEIFIFIVWHLIFVFDF